MNRKEKREKEVQKDKKFEKSMAFCRVDKIFDSIEKNLTPQQITDILNNLPKVRPDKRGQESVDNVKKAIYDLSVIYKIQSTSHQSYEDRCLKYDLIAHLTTGGVLDFIGIQVKSSPDAISKFYHQINPRHLEIEDILIKKQLIVLNGQISPAEIRNDFLKQLRAINNFYLNNPKT